MSKLIILSGYTGVGKTEISIQLAKKINAEIVSCDSLLVYKHLNIGTDKPKATELCIIPHHCIDIIEPNEDFDVQKYITHAQRAIMDIFSCKKNVIIVGGTGFYLKSFFSPVVDNIIISPEAEQFVNDTLNRNTPEVLIKKLLELNNGEIDIDLKNIRRVTSVLKRCLSSGLTHEQIKERFQKQSSAFANYSKYTILLTRDDDDLKNRIKQRIINMLNSGLIQEVQNLLQNEKFNNINRSSIGYRETISWLKNPTSIEILINTIYQDTLRLVKKQKTWFKKQIPIDWHFNISNKNLSTIISELEEILPI